MARTSIIRRLPAALAAALVLGVAGAPPPAAALTPRPVDGVFGVISAGQPTGRATITRQGTRIAPGATFYADCRKLMVPTGIVVRSGRFDYRGRVAGRAGTLHVSATFVAYRHGSTFAHGTGRYTRAHATADFSFAMQLGIKGPGDCRAQAAPRHLLSVAVGHAPSGGSGIVTGAGIACSGIGGDTSGCLKSIPDGTLVTLTATPDPGSVFTGWNQPPSPCAGTDPCTFRLTADTTVVAVFVPAALVGPPPPY